MTALAAALQIAAFGNVGPTLTNSANGSQKAHLVPTSRVVEIDRRSLTTYYGGRRNQLCYTDTAVPTFIPTHIRSPPTDSNDSNSPSENSLLLFENLPLSIDWLAQRSKGTLNTLDAASADFWFRRLYHRIDR